MRMITPYSSGLPSPPTVNTTGDTVCFWSHSIFPIDYYSIEIVDLTGAHEYLILNETSANETESCTSLSEESYPPECSPYNIFVGAHNDIGKSNTSVTTMQGIPLKM